MRQPPAVTGRNRATGSAFEPTPLVGRAQERVAIDEVLELVVTGSGAALLVAGEAGIGKTRLAGEAVASARHRHFTVLRGQAQPLDHVAGFAPLAEAFGRYLRAVPSPVFAELTAGLPMLGVLVADLGLPDASPDPTAPGQRMRLFDAALRLLGRIASAGPAMLVVDDLQWADGASLELLGHLTRELGGLPVLLVATYRPDEVAAGVASLLETVHRCVATRVIAPGRLGLDDVRTMLAGALGARPSPPLVEFLVGRSRGIPLYVQAFGRWLVESGQLVVVDGEAALAHDGDPGVPPAISDVIRGQLDRLPGAERDALELVVAGGEHSDVELLCAVGGEAARPALDALLARGLVVEAADGWSVTVRPYHPLVHEVAYQAIPAHRRRALHARFAGSLAGGRDPMAAGAHALAAGPAIPAPEAARMLLDAGRAALRRFAHENAAGYLAQAVELADDTTPELLAEALTAYGHALRLNGEATQAVRAWRRALERTAPGDAATRARLHGLIADAHSDRGEVTAAVHEVQAALAAVEGMPPTADSLELHFVLMVNHQRQLDVPAAAAVAKRIDVLAHQVATPQAKLLAAFANLGMLVEQARYREASTLVVPYAAQLAQDETLYRYVVQFRALEALALGDLARLRDANAEIAATDRHSGIPGWNYRRYLYAFGEALYRGAWDEAQDVLDEFEIAAATSQNSRVITIGPVVGAMLAAYRGEQDDAQRRLAHGRERLERGLIEPAVGRAVLAIFGAIVALERGDATGARELLEPVVASRPYVLAGVIPPWGLLALAEARARTGATDASRQAAGLLAAVGPPGTLPAAAAARIEGLAAAADGDAHQARRLLLDAHAGFERLRMPFETARAAIEAAEVGGGDGLSDLVASAHRVTVAMGARRYKDRAALLLRAAGAAVPQQPRADPVELTRRQREVAGLVATGLSNAEIAERMFVSVRTVTAHLDHIYTRLGIKSRAALATYITERRHREPDRT